MKAPGVIIPRHYFNEAELEQLFDLAPNLMPCIYADKENIDIECFYVNWLYSYVQRYRISSFRSLKKHFKKEKFHEGCVNNLFGFLEKNEDMFSVIFKIQL